MRWWGYALVFLFVLGFAGVATFRSFLHREKAAFEKRVDALREAGEPVSLTEIRNLEVPADQDARPLLEAVAAKVQALQAETPTPDYASLVPELEKALARPRCTWPPPPPEMPMSAADVSFIIYPIFVLREVVESGDGSLATARSALQMESLYRPLGCCFPVLIRGGAVEVAGDALSTASQQPGFGASAVRKEFADRFVSFERSLDVRAILSSERAAMIEYVRHWEEFGNVEFSSFGRGPEWWDDLYQTPLWEPVVFRDASRMLDLWAEGMRRATGVSGSVHADLARWREEQTENSAHPMASSACWFPERVVGSLLRMLSRSRQTRIALAVWEFQARTGEYPKSLDALEFEDGVPEDPITEGPFEYERAQSRATLTGKSFDGEPAVWKFGVR